VPPSSSTSSSSGSAAGRSAARELWKLVRNGLLLLVLLFVLDRALGALAEHWFLKTRDGDTGETTNALLESRSAVVVFGDSRAESHYVPAKISAALKTSAFNAGFKGSNTIYDFGLQQLIFDHYTPRLIVLDFSAYSLMKTHDNPYNRLEPLYPYWRDPAVWRVIDSGDWKQRLTFFSRLYPYNSKIHSIVMFNVMAHRPHAADGYEPQFGVMGDQPLEPLDRRPVAYSDDLTAYLERFLVSAHDHGVPVVIVQSPRHAAGSFVLPPQIKQRVDEFAIPVIDFDTARYPQFADHRLYRDPSHLNDSGAEQFSELLGAKLCEIYCAALQQPRATAAR
jgi:hypothetical protein